LCLAPLIAAQPCSTLYKTVELRLHPADPSGSHYLEWEAQVGFIGGWHSYSFVLLGSVGVARPDLPKHTSREYSSS
jgi:hypothetical protein